MSSVRTLHKAIIGDGAPTKKAGRSAEVPQVRWTWIALIEFCVVAITAYLTSLVYHALVYSSLSAGAVYIPFSLFLAAFYFLICVMGDQYNLHSEEWSNDGIASGVKAVALAFTFVLALAFIFDWASSLSRGTFLSQLALVSAGVVITRVVLTQRLEAAVRTGRVHGRGMIVISLVAGFNFDDYATKLCSRSDRVVDSYDIQIEGTDRAKQNPSGRLANVIEHIRKECRRPEVDLVVVIYDAGHQADVEKIVEAFYELPVHVRLLPVGMIPFMQRSQVIETGSFPTLEISSQPFSFLGRFLKRAMDLAVAIPSVILFSPLLSLVAIAIKLDSPGPVLFRQTRHGFNNEPIEVLKFRTMKTPKDKERFRQAIKNDPRVTRVGRLLRRTNIDELPQLFNVIRGEMSIVGPRPHATAHNDAFANQIKMIYRRHNVKPGITGWAQVNGLRGETDTCEKMQKRIEYDLYYIDNWSIFFDIKILLVTLLSKRAYLNAY